MPRIKKSSKGMSSRIYIDATEGGLNKLKTMYVSKSCDPEEVLSNVVFNKLGKEYPNAIKKFNVDFGKGRELIKVFNKVTPSEKKAMLIEKMETFNRDFASVSTDNIDKCHLLINDIRKYLKKGNAKQLLKVWSNFADALIIFFNELCSITCDYLYMRQLLSGLCVHIMYMWYLFGELYLENAGTTKMIERLRNTNPAKQRDNFFDVRLKRQLSAIHKEKNEYRVFETLKSKVTLPQEMQEKYNKTTILFENLEDCCDEDDEAKSADCNSNVNDREGMDSDESNSDNSGCSNISNSDNNTDVEAEKMHLLKEKSVKKPLKACRKWPKRWKKEAESTTSVSDSDDTEQCELVHKTASKRSTLLASKEKSCERVENKSVSGSVGPMEGTVSRMSEMSLVQSENGKRRLAKDRQQIKVQEKGGKSVEAVQAHIAEKIREVEKEDVVKEDGTHTKGSKENNLVDDTESDFSTLAMDRNDRNDGNDGNDGNDSKKKAENEHGEKEELAKSKSILKERDTETRDVDEENARSRTSFVKRKRHHNDTEGIDDDASEPCDKKKATVCDGNGIEWNGKKEANEVLKGSGVTKANWTGNTTNPSSNEGSSSDEHLNVKNVKSSCQNSSGNLNGTGGSVSGSNGGERSSVAADLKSLSTIVFKDILRDMFVIGNESGVEEMFDLTREIAYQDLTFPNSKVIDERKSEALKKMGDLHEIEQTGYYIQVRDFLNSSRNKKSELDEICKKAESCCPEIVKVYKQGGQGGERKVLEVFDKYFATYKAFIEFEFYKQEITECNRKISNFWFSWLHEPLLMYQEWPQKSEDSKNTEIDLYDLNTMKGQYAKLTAPHFRLVKEYNNLLKKSELDYFQQNLEKMANVKHQDCGRDFEKIACLNEQIKQHNLEVAAKERKERMKKLILETPRYKEMMTLLQEQVDVKMFLISFDKEEKGTVRDFCKDKAERHLDHYLTILERAMNDIADIEEGSDLEKTAQDISDTCFSVGHDISEKELILDIAPSELAILESLFLDKDESINPNPYYSFAERIRYYLCILLWENEVLQTVLLDLKNEKFRGFPSSETYNFKERWECLQSKAASILTSKWQADVENEVSQLMDCAIRQDNELNAIYTDWRNSDLPMAKQKGMTMDEKIKSLESQFTFAKNNVRSEIARLKSYEKKWPELQDVLTLNIQDREMRLKELVGYILTLEQDRIEIKTLAGTLRDALIENMDKINKAFSDGLQANEKDRDWFWHQKEKVKSTVLHMYKNQGREGLENLAEQTTKLIKKIIEDCVQMLTYLANQTVFIDTVLKTKHLDKFGKLQSSICCKYEWLKVLEAIMSEEDYFKRRVRLNVPTFLVQHFGDKEAAQSEKWVETAISSLESYMSQLSQLPVVDKKVVTIPYQFESDSVIQASLASARQLLEDMFQAEKKRIQTENDEKVFEKLRETVSDGKYDILVALSSLNQTPAERNALANNFLTEVNDYIRKKLLPICPSKETELQTFYSQIRQNVEKVVTMANGNSEQILRESLQNAFDNVNRLIDQKNPPPQKALAIAITPIVKHIDPAKHSTIFDAKTLKWKENDGCKWLTDGLAKCSEKLQCMYSQLTALSGQHAKVTEDILQNPFLVHEHDIENVINWRESLEKDCISQLNHMTTEYYELLQAFDAAVSEFYNSFASISSDYVVIESFVDKCYLQKLLFTKVIDLVRAICTTLQIATTSSELNIEYLHNAKSKFLDSEIQYFRNVDKVESAVSQIFTNIQELMVTRADVDWYHCRLGEIRNEAEKLYSNLKANIACNSGTLALPEHEMDQSFVDTLNNIHLIHQALGKLKYQYGHGEIAFQKYIAEFVKNSANLFWGALNQRFLDRVQLKCATQCRDRLQQEGRMAIEHLCSDLQTKSASLIKDFSLGINEKLLECESRFETILSNFLDDIVRVLEGSLAQLVSDCLQALQDTFQLSELPNPLHIMIPIRKIVNRLKSQLNTTKTNLHIHKMENKASMYDLAVSILVNIFKKWSILIETANSQEWQKMSENTVTSYVISTLVKWAILSSFLHTRQHFLGQQNQSFFGDCAGQVPERSVHDLMHSSKELVHGIRQFSEKISRVLDMEKIPSLDRDDVVELYMNDLDSLRSSIESQHNFVVKSMPNSLKECPPLKALAQMYKIICSRMEVSKKLLTFRLHIIRQENELSGSNILKQGFSCTLNPWYFIFKRHEDSQDNLLTIVNELQSSIQEFSNLLHETNNKEEKVEKVSVSDLYTFSNFDNSVLETLNFSHKWEIATLFGEKLFELNNKPDACFFIAISNNIFEIKKMLSHILSQFNAKNSETITHWAEPWAEPWSFSQHVSGWTNNVNNVNNALEWLDIYIRSSNLAKNFDRQTVLDLIVRCYYFNKLRKSNMKKVNIMYLIDPYVSHLVRKLPMIIIDTSDKRTLQDPTWKLNIVPSLCPNSVTSVFELAVPNMLHALLHREEFSHQIGTNTSMILEKYHCRYPHFRGGLDTYKAIGKVIRDNNLWRLFSRCIASYSNAKTSEVNFWVNELFRRPFSREWIEQLQLDYGKGVENNMVVYLQNDGTEVELVHLDLYDFFILVLGSYMAFTDIETNVTSPQVFTLLQYNPYNQYSEGQIIDVRLNCNNVLGDSNWTILLNLCLLAERVQPGFAYVSRKNFVDYFTHDQLETNERYWEYYSRIIWMFRIYSCYTQLSNVKSIDGINSAWGKDFGPNFCPLYDLNNKDLFHTDKWLQMKVDSILPESKLHCCLVALVLNFTKNVDTAVDLLFGRMGLFGLFFKKTKANVESAFNEAKMKILPWDDFCMEASNAIRLWIGAVCFLSKSSLGTFIREKLVKLWQKYGNAKEESLWNHMRKMYTIQTGQSLSRSTLDKSSVLNEHQKSNIIQKALNQVYGIEDYSACFSKKVSDEISRGSYVTEYITYEVKDESVDIAQPCLFDILLFCWFMQIQLCVVSCENEINVPFNGWREVVNTSFTEKFDFIDSEKLYQLIPTITNTIGAETLGMMLSKDKHLMSPLMTMAWDKGPTHENDMNILEQIVSTSIEKSQTVRSYTTIPILRVKLEKDSGTVLSNIDGLSYSVQHESISPHYEEKGVTFLTSIPRNFTTEMGISRQSFGPSIKRFLTQEMQILDLQNLVETSLGDDLIETDVSDVSRRKTLKTPLDRHPNTAHEKERQIRQATQPNITPVVNDANQKEAQDPESDTSGGKSKKDKIGRLQTMLAQVAPQQPIHKEMRPTRQTNLPNLQRRPSVLQELIGNKKPVTPVRQKTEATEPEETRSKEATEHTPDTPDTPDRRKTPVSQGSSGLPYKPYKGTKDVQTEMSRIPPLGKVQKPQIEISEISEISEKQGIPNKERRPVEPVEQMTTQDAQDPTKTRKDRHTGAQEKMHKQTERLEEKEQKATNLEVSTREQWFRRKESMTQMITQFLQPQMSKIKLTSDRNQVREVREVRQMKGAAADPKEASANAFAKMLKDKLPKLPDVKKSYSQDLKDLNQQRAKIEKFLYH